MITHRFARRTLTALALVVAVACSDPGAPTPAAVDLSGADAAIGLLRGSLLSCVPLAADSASATIGPAGGVINVGPHALVVPAEALAAPVTITAVAPSDTVRRVDFGPDGLQFARPARLTMSYAGCDLLGSVLPKRVAQIDGALTILAALPSLDLRSVFTTSASLEHFSGYAVAW